jgi:dolichol-phosphate mannosyltransferase
MLCVQITLAGFFIHKVHGLAHPKLTIIIPTLDEGQNIRELFRRLFRISGVKGAQIIIADSGSTDSTCDEVEKAMRLHKNVELLHAPEGKGIALRLAFGRAKSEKIIFLDGDLQYPPEEIPKILSKLRSFDLVCTKRLHASWSHRRMLSLGFSQVVGKGMLFLPVSDPQSGMKGVRKSLLSKLTLHSRNWELDAELIKKAQAMGAKICEVEIEFHPRKAGKTKTGLVGTTVNLFHGAVSLAVSAGKGKSGQNIYIH